MKMSFGWSVDIGFRNLCVVLFRKSDADFTVLHVSLTRFEAHPRKQAVQFKRDFTDFIKHLLGVHAAILKEHGANTLTRIFVEAQVKVNRLARSVSATLTWILRHQNGAVLHLPKVERVAANVKKRLYSEHDNKRLLPGLKHKPLRKAHAAKTFIDNVPCHAQGQFKKFKQLHDVADATLQALASVATR